MKLRQPKTVFHECFKSELDLYLGLTVRVWELQFGCLRRRVQHLKLRRLGTTVWGDRFKRIEVGVWCAGLFKLAGLLDSRFRQDFRSLSPPSPQRGRAFLGTQCAGQGFARRCFPFEVYSYIEFRFVSSLGIPGHWF